MKLTLETHQMNPTLESLSLMLNTSGIESEFFRLNKRWYALKVTAKSANKWFWVRHSNQGWFLGDKDVFHVPGPSQVLGLCIAWATGLEPRSRLISSFGLELRTTWMHDETSGDEDTWRSIGWSRLSDAETTLVFDAFERKFSYPSDHFSPPPPSATWDFSHLYDCDLCNFKELSEQLNKTCLASMRQYLAKFEEMIAIDFNHCAYRLDAASKLDSGVSELWPISIFPDGDYHMFVSTDFRIGVVADPSGVIIAYGPKFCQTLQDELGKTLLKPETHSEVV